MYIVQSEVFSIQMEEIKLFVSGIFNEDDTTRLLLHLTQIGAESMDDLLRLQVDMDVGDDVLPILKRRRLSSSLQKLNHPVSGQNTCFYQIKFILEFHSTSFENSLNLFHFI